MKKFNGRKMSHVRHSDKDSPKCPMCGSPLLVVQGLLRCAVLKSVGQVKKSQRIVIKYGSLATIHKRMTKGYKEREI